MFDRSLLLHRAVFHHDGDSDGTVGVPLNVRVANSENTDASPCMSAENDDDLLEASLLALLGAENGAPLADGGRPLRARRIAG